MKKNKDQRSTFVYSTDPDFKIQLETKHRAGKTVTVVLGFIGLEDDLAQLGKDLKNHCGTGGSAKDGEIILQGDHREKIKQWLQKKGYKTK
jgi:translation initiation factor 1